MTQVKLGDTVKVHYTGKLVDGSVFDSSQSRDPLEFTTGQGTVIPGFERAVLGMSPGDSKTEQIPCELAYGPYQDQLAVELDRGEFANRNITPQVGMELQVRQQDGQSVPVMVTEVSDNRVKLDANHPLAGKSLTFEISLVAIV